MLKHSDVVADHSDEAMGYTKVNSQTVCLLPDAAFAWGCFGSIAAIREKRLRAALTHGGRSHKCSVPEIRGTYLWFSPHDTANPSRAPSVGRVDSKACRPQRLNVKTVIKWRSRTTTQDAQMGDIECYHPAPPCNPLPTFSIAISYPQEPCTRSPQGINSLPVAANSATGFGDPDKLGAAAPHTIAGAFFASAASCHGGCARETFGSAGFQVPGSPTCVQLPPIVWRQCVVVPT